MDGTLVDTEPFWMAAEGPLIESYGGTWSHEQALGLVVLGLKSGHMTPARVMLSLRDDFAIAIDANAIDDAAAILARHWFLRVWPFILRPDESAFNAGFAVMRKHHEDAAVRDVVGTIRMT